MSIDDAETHPSKGTESFHLPLEDTRKEGSFSYV